jgi:hypothetical protein
LDVTLLVGNVKKIVRVFGDRQWISSRPSAPMSFETVPLVYESAFGGSHQTDDEVLFEPRNPVGKGFAGKRKNKELEQLPLPNIEDPRHLLSGPGDIPAPAGFGYIAPSWDPRKMYAGTYDEKWQKHRAPYLPDDFNPRFFNAAHPELVYAGFLEGGEPVQVANASPYGPLGFRLPVCRMEAVVSLAGNKEKPPLNLETLLIEPDHMRFSMLWRGIVACDKKALKIEQIDIDLKQLDFIG